MKYDAEPGKFNPVLIGTDSARVKKASFAVTRFKGGDVCALCRPDKALWHAASGRKRRTEYAPLSIYLIPQPNPSAR